MFKIKDKIKQIFKSGNSLALVIPSNMAKAMELEDGTMIKISYEENEIRIKKVLQ